MTGTFSEWLQETLYYLPALLIALSVHEAAHAYTAYKLGDKSQKALGRLSLSPLSHIDPIVFIFMLVFKFGWGKPVVMDDRNFKNRRKGIMLVALAGPLSNIILAFVFTIILKLLDVFGALAIMINSNIGNILYIMLLYMIGFNVMFGVFNLIPLPPFDGAKVLTYFLPEKAKRGMDWLEQYSIWIIAILMLTDVYQLIISPAYNFIYWLISLILAL